MTTATATPAPVADPKQTSVRQFRIEDQVWTAGKERAERAGTTISALLREFVVRYAAGDEAEQLLPPTPADVARLATLRDLAGQMADLLDVCK